MLMNVYGIPGGFMNSPCFDLFGIRQIYKEYIGNEN